VHWLLLLPCVLVACLIWFPVLSLIVHPWVRVVPFDKGKETVPALSDLSRAKYILVAGVLQWGWACFLGNALFDYLAYRYWGGTARMLSPQRLFVSFVTWSLAGIFFGWMTRNSSQKIAPPSKPDSQLR